MHLDALDPRAANARGARKQGGDKASERLPVGGAVDRQHVVRESDHDGHDRLGQYPHVQPGARTIAERRHPDAVDPCAADGYGHLPADCFLTIHWMRPPGRLTAEDSWRAPASGAAAARTPTIAEFGSDRLGRMFPTDPDGGGRAGRSARGARGGALA
ncbi:hypothetical protein GCM10010398_38080 [Streptomyces fimbriatus]